MMDSVLMALLVVAVLPFVFVVLMLRVFLNTRLSRLAVDQPNQRSLHTTPVPRTGGLMVMSAVLLSWGLMGHAWLLLVAVCVVLLMAISFFDDLYGLSAALRFSGQFVVAGFFVVYGLPINSFLLMGVLVFALVWMTNLFNFMDGSDGLAGGMALFGFGTYAVVAGLAGANQFALACLAISVASAGFLVYNFHPAKIFMGDAGSIPLGFLAGALGLYGWQQACWPIWFPALVFSPFVVDATVTLIKRILRREKIWQAHRSHYYQRLVQMGWGHRKTAVCEYGLMSLVGVSAVSLVEMTQWVQGTGLLMWLLVYASIIMLVDRLWKKHLTHSGE